MSGIIIPRISFVIKKRETEIKNNVHIAEQIYGDTKIINDEFEKIKKNAIIKSYKATASTNAKPNIPIGKTCERADGFLAIADTKAAKILPIPAPTPPRPITANPAPIILAASISIESS